MRRPRAGARRAPGRAGLGRAAERGEIASGNRLERLAPSNGAPLERAGPQLGLERPGNDDAGVRAAGVVRSRSSRDQA